MGSGPVKGLEALTGMGLKELEVRVREVFAWGSQWTNVWDMSYETGYELGLTPCFTWEAVIAFEKRLVLSMESKKGSISKEERTEGEDGAQVEKCDNNPGYAKKKVRGKRRASGVAGYKGKKRLKVGTAR